MPIIELPCVNVKNAENLPLVVDFPGGLKVVSGGLDSTPGAPQTVLTQVVPVGKSWRVRKVDFISRAYGAFSFKVNGSEKLSAKSNPADSTVSLDLVSYLEVLAGETITVSYSQDNNPAVPIETKIFYTEH